MVDHDSNMSRLRDMSERYPAVKEFYQDIAALWCHGNQPEAWNSGDWEWVFNEAYRRIRENKTPGEQT